MNVTENDLIGEIEGFPLPIVKLMLRRQVEAGNPRDVTIFQECANASTKGGGFNWDDAPEDFNFWDKVIMDRDFEKGLNSTPKSRKSLVDHLDEWVQQRGPLTPDEKDAMIAWIDRQ